MRTRESTVAGPAPNLRPEWNDSASSASPTLASPRSYNALAGGGALAAPYAFATVDPNVGVAKVPDDRLDQLAEMSQSKNVVPASVQFVDIAGLVKGAAQGEGLGNRFLSHIREVDAIVFVLRAFDDDDVPGSSDPVEQLDTLEVELVYSDLETVEKQVDKRRKAVTGRQVARPRGRRARRRHRRCCRPGTPLYRTGLSEDHARCSARTSCSRTSRRWPSSTSTRTSSVSPTTVTAGVRAAMGPDADVIAVCVQLEAEAVLLDEDERAEMLDALGLGDGALASFLRTAYHCSDCAPSSPPVRRSRGRGRSGPDRKAPQAAGVIHTDFEKGFIRAEVHPLGRAVGAGIVVEGP